MLSTPEIINTPEQHAAVIHLTVPAAEIRKIMGPGIGEVQAAVAAQGLKTAAGTLGAPWYTHHFKVPDSTFDFEIGVPVTAPVKATGRVKPGKLPAAKMAHAVYHGPYEGLGAAWGEFMAWIAANGHTPAADLWECYVTGPESGADSSKWRTEFYRPLA